MVEECDYECIEKCTKDLSDERKFLEDLLTKRFHFFVIFFSAVVGGAIACRNAWTVLVLAGGSVICWLLTLTIWRSQQKFDIIFKLLPADHPAKVVDRMAGKGRLCSMRRIVGYVIPALCSLLLSGMAFVAILYYGLLLPLRFVLGCDCAR